MLPRWEWEREPKGALRPQDRKCGGPRRGNCAQRQMSGKLATLPGAAQGQQLRSFVPPTEPEPSSSRDRVVVPLEGKGPQMVPAGGCLAPTHCSLPGTASSFAPRA